MIGNYDSFDLFMEVYHIRIRILSGIFYTIWNYNHCIGVK